MDWLVAHSGWLVLGFYALVVVRWVGGHAILARITKARRLLPLATRDPGPQRRVSVIIPAHNEASGIAACLKRVLEQDYDNLQVIVANDRSTDATGAIVRQFAAAHSNVRCVDITELPAGWLGKTHALSVAARDADGELLVFTDGDVVWHPALLRTVLNLMQTHRLDFVSLWPLVLVRSFWEGFLIPACGWILSLWFHVEHVEDITDRLAFANGQFIAVWRMAYEQIGGHATVPNEMAEDVALAKRAQALGLRCHLGIGRELLTTRMYENYAQIISGWTRVFIGSLGARWKLLLSMFVTLISIWPPFIALAIGLAVLAGGGHPSPLLVGWMAIAAVHLVAMYTLLYRHYSCGFDGRTYLPFFPLAALGVVILLGYCVLLISGVGTIPWGGMRFKVRGSQAIASHVGD
jgi:chlorobactene glucosyltransferase